MRAEVGGTGDIGELCNKINSLINGKKKVIDEVVKTNNELGTLKQKFHEIFASSRENASKISQRIKNIIEGSGDIQKDAIVKDAEEIAIGIRRVSDESKKIVGDGVKAIEAARSRENGKGFTVLAEEIRKLSDGSNKAASDIKVQIKEIQEQVKYAVESIKIGIVDVDNSIQKINIVKDTVFEAVSSMEYVVDSVKNTAHIARGYDRGNGRC